MIIQTAYLGPTNTKGGRVKASVPSGSFSVTVEWDHALGIQENHDAAAAELVRRHGAHTGANYMRLNTPGGGFIFFADADAWSAFADPARAMKVA